MQQKHTYNEYKERVSRSYEISDEDYSLWLQSVKSKLGVLDKAPWSLSIYTVPSRLRKIDKDPYSPHTVSIGPLHHHKHEFAITDEHKWTYMLYLMARTNVPHIAIEKCAEIIKRMEIVARRSYAENFMLEKLEMMEILLVDGCFMLEIFIRYSEASQHEGDPILENKRLVQDLQQDFALVENQVPFAILVSLFDAIQKCMNGKFCYSLHRYALYFFHTALKLSEIAIDKRAKLLSEINIKHIVHLLHCVYFSTMPKNIEETAIEFGLELLRGPKTRRQSRPSKAEIQGFEHSATELHHAGIHIMSGDKDRLLHITFENGTLTIPCFNINRRTNPIFRNLIAFEQCSSTSTNHMLSYATLMRTLIHSSHDVELLKQKGIIKQASCGGRDVLGLLEGFCEEVDLEEFEFAPLCEKVNDYMKKRTLWCRITAWLKDLWHRSKAALRDEIFATTWSILSIAAAIVLLTLTALQTLFTAITYYQRTAT